MDAKNRANRGKGARNRNVTASGSRSQLTNKRVRPAVKSAIGKRNNQNSPQKKFDNNRLSFRNNAGESQDLRDKLKEKKEEEERRKRFASNLQSRLGLQSRAAREEAKKKQNEQTKSSKPSPNIKPNKRNVRPTNPSKNNNNNNNNNSNKAERREATGNRSIRVDERREQRKSNAANARDLYLNKRRNLTPPLEIRPKISSQYSLYSKDNRLENLPLSRPIVEPAYESYVSPRPRFTRVVQPSPSYITEVPSTSFAREMPRSGGQGHSVLLTNLNPMISKEDVRELFEDIGPIAGIQSINPNSHLVTYFTRYDAEKACQVYHNRKLDDRPIYCTIVPDPSTSSNISSAMLTNRQTVSAGRLYSDEIPIQRPQVYY